MTDVRSPLVTGTGADRLLEWLLMVWWFRRRPKPGDEVVSARLPAAQQHEVPSEEELAALAARAELGDDVAMGNLGAALHLTGDQAGALHWWGRAWEAGNVVAGYNLGMLYMAAGDANRAQVVWEKAAALGDPDAMLGLVKQALDRGDTAGVERWVPVILGQDEAFPITALGVAFRDRGDLTRAVEAFLRAEELGDGYAMEYRARILAAQGRREEAEALLARAARAERML
ncbi:tetratricopeptide repeat protein [Kitasatospora sp. NPDC051853]|uniref:tetratricopeptide repeat protein n=1 Tax=Kitasatospora sp. NPDC051853 TaxID=3364058 RepID=UPI00379C0630